MSNNLKTLISKLNDNCRRAAERAASLCMAKSHFEVDIEHLFLALLEQPQSDFTLICQRSDVSPTALAQRIRAPVFLAAGGKDEIAPQAHSERMEKALKAAGVPVETLYVRTEGHGFYSAANQRAYYTRLLEFLSRHLGGAKAK